MIDAVNTPAVALLQGWYPQIKLTHVGLVAASGLLFAARGLAVLRRAAWPGGAPARRLSVVLDTLLLAAGAALWTLLGLNPLRDAWLGIKLLLLVAYIAAGSVALKRGRTPRVRALAFGLALGLYLFIVGIARSHQPLGPLAPWMSA